MIRLLRKLSLFCTLLLIAGCANVNKHAEKHFDRTQAGIANARDAANSAGLATVYLLIPKEGGLQFTFVPVSPAYFAVDGMVLSVMPVGSHIVLSLVPGRHIFSSFRVHSNFRYHELDRKDVTIDVAADREYFVGQKYLYLFEQLNERDGREAVKKTELAKLVHHPVSVETFIANFEASKQQRIRQAASAPTSTTTISSDSNGFNNLLPSSKQVGEFLEGLAAVALIGLALFGAGLAASAGNNLHYTPSQLAPVQAQVQPFRNQPQGIVHQPLIASQTWQSSSGTLSEIIRSKSEVTVRNTATGASYRIEDGQITGSDGSRFRVIGSMIYSETGQSYQVVGNTLFASDGRKCDKVGSIMMCN